MFRWLLGKLRDLVSDLIERLVIPLLGAVETWINERIAYDIIPFAGQIVEYIFVGVLITPLFLINQLTTAVDIFSGVKPIYENERAATDRIDADEIEVIYDDSPQYLLWKEEYGYIPPYPPQVLPALPPDSGHSISELIEACDELKALWSGYIQSNDSIVLRITRDFEDPMRYMPYVRTFIQENGIEFGSEQMYRALVNAVTMGAEVGTGISAAGLDAPPEVSAEAVIKTMVMPRSLNVPYFEYDPSSDYENYYVWLEAFSKEGLYVPNIHDYGGNRDGFAGDLIDALDQENLPAYREIFAETMNSGYIDPDYLGQRLKYLRENPSRSNTQELNMLHNSFLIDKATIREYMEEGPYSRANVLAASDIECIEVWNKAYPNQKIDIPSEDGSGSGPDAGAGSGSGSGSGSGPGSEMGRIPYFYHWPSSAKYPDFYMSYSVSLTAEELPSTDGFDTFGTDITLACYFPANELWIDYIQNNADIVDRWEKPYDDMARYTLDVQDFIAGRWVAPGTDFMYHHLAHAIYKNELPVGNVPVNRWLPRDLGYTPYPGELEIANVPKTFEFDTSVTLLSYFFSNEVVTTLFWGITIISMALCIGFSIYAVVRSMGDLKMEKPVGKVLGLTGKSMLTFLVMPFFCISILGLAGVVLKQTTALVGGADGESVTVTGSLFCATLVPEAVLCRNESALLNSFKVDRSGQIAMERTYLSASDEAREKRYNELMRKYRQYDIDFLHIDDIRKDFDIAKLFWPGYAVIIALGAWIFVVLMVMVLFVFIRRVFDIIMLYIVSPIFAATIPLDDGRVFKNWRERFIGQSISGFGSLITFKLFLLMLPLIWTSGLRLTDNMITDNVIKALLMLGGVFAVFKSHTLITSLVSPTAAESDLGALAFAASVVGKPAEIVTEEISKELKTMDSPGKKGKDKKSGDDSKSSGKDGKSPDGDSDGGSDGEGSKGGSGNKNPSLGGGGGMMNEASKGDGISAATGSDIGGGTKDKGGNKGGNKSGNKSGDKGGDKSGDKGGEDTSNKNPGMDSNKNSDTMKNADTGGDGEKK